MEMTKVLSPFQRSMLTHVYSASEIGETELENPFSNLRLLEVDTSFILVTLDLSVLGFSLDVLQWVFSQANRPHL